MKINTKLNKWCARRLDHWEERIIRRSSNALWQMPIIAVIMIVILIFGGRDAIRHQGPFEIMIMAIILVLIENIIRKIIIYKKGRSK